MPLRLRVDTELNDRSVADTASKAKSAFDAVGREISVGLSRGITSELDKIGPSFIHLGTAGKSAMSEMGSSAQSALSGISTAAVATGLGIAAIGTAVVAAGKAFYELGAEWDTVSDSIVAKTGIMGAELNSLVDSVRQVSKEAAISIGDIGNIAGAVAQSLHQTGSAATELTQTLSDLQQITGQVTDIRGLGKAFRLFDISDSRDQVAAINELKAAADATGMPVNALIQALEKAGKSAKTFGLDFATTAGLIVTFEEAGLNSEKAATGLGLALKNLAAQGKEGTEGLEEAILQIKRLHDAGQEAAAINLATSVFGRSTVDFLPLIEDGTLDVQQLHEVLRQLGADDTIDKQKKATQDWNEEWVKLKNTLSSDLEPVATRVFSGINAQLKWELDTVTTLNERYGQLVDLFRGPMPQVPEYHGGFSVGPMGAPGAMRPPTPSGVGGAANVGILPGNTTGTWWGYQPPQTGGKSSGPQVPYPPGYTGTPAEKAQHDVAQAEADLAAAQASGDPNAITAANNRLKDAQIALGQAQQGPGGGPQVPAPPGLGAPPRPGETGEQYGREQAVYGAQWKVAQAQAEVRAATTTEELVKAQNDLANANSDLNKAVLALNDSSSQAGKNLDDIGVKLDQDFGLSRGLPGLAENLVRFLANLAFAPAMGAMRGAQAGLGYPGGQGLGGGLIGMAAAGGLFGPQFQTQPGTGGAGGGNNAFPGGYPYPYTNQYPVQYPGGGSTPYPGVFPQPATTLGSLSSPADFAGAGNRVAAVWAAAYALQGTPYSQALRNDCSGMVSQIVSAAVGLPPPTAAQRFNTTNEGQWLASHGFLPGVGPPGSLQVGWNPAPGNAGHTAVTLPGGIGAESGGGGGGFRIGGPGAFQPQFTNQAWLPMMQSGGAVDWPHLPPNPPPGWSNFNPKVQLDSSRVSIPAPGYLGYPPWVYTGTGRPYTAGQQYPGRDPLDILWAASELPSAYASGGAVPIIAHAGEHVLTESDVAAMGGQGGVYAFRNALHRQGGGDVPKVDVQVTPPPAPPPAPAPPAGPPTIGGVPAPVGIPVGPPMPPGQQGPTNIGGVAPPEGYGGGFQITGGGLIGVLESLPATAIQYGISAGMAAGAAADEGGAILSMQEGGAVGGAGGGAAGGGGAGGPGGDVAGSVISAAIGIAISEINRAIGFGAQAAGIGVSGLMQTFLPTAGSQLAQNNWITRFLGGIIGAHPNLPNISSARGQQQSQLSPEQVLAMAPPLPPGAGQPGQTAQHGTYAGQPPGPQIGVQIQNYNVNQSEDRAGQDIARWNMPGQR